MEQGQFGRFKYLVEKASGPDKPVVLHLHGQGERGSNVNDVLLYGPLYFIKKGVKLPDANYIQPQLPTGNWEPKDVHELLMHCLATFNGDPGSLHLMGVSLGGWGVRNYLAWPFSTNLTSAVLMSPGGERWTDYQIQMISGKGVPIWISHATNDIKAGAEYETSLDAVTRLREKGTKAELRFTTFGLTGHSTRGAWERFMEPTHFYLWEWMMAQKREPAVVLGNIEEVKAKMIEFIRTL